jgi:hypothetical protein
MAYWRMQLHPDDAPEALRYSVESLAAGYIGLDFATDIPDLMTIEQSALPQGERQYWLFAREMARGDNVLIFVHHFPFALVTIANNESGDYNYIRRRAPEIGVWFRHFRGVERPVRFYADFQKDSTKHQRIEMLDTIQPLRDPNSKSHQLMEEWLRG